MSGWRGREQKQASFNKNADRLREKLYSNREDEGEAPKRPTGLKGREIGMWYAQQQKKRKGSETRMVSWQIP